MRRENVKVIEKPIGSRHVRMDEEVPDTDTVMVKGSVIRFSDSFADTLRFKRGGQSVVFAVAEVDGEPEYGVAVLPSTTSNRGGYKVTLTPSGWQTTSKGFYSQGGREGLYLVGMPYQFTQGNDELDVYPLEWVKNVR